MNIEQRIINALHRVGIYIDNISHDDDVDLRDCISDSLQFISAVLELETEFDIDFPDEYMLIDKFASLKGLATEIEEFLN